MLTQAQRHEIWEAMADHFLDTDTTEWIPRTARLCVEAGLTTAEAGDIWRFEVTPAVWPNVWSVAGEWACWSTEWLFATIERERDSWLNRPGWLGELVYRLRVHYVHEDWLAIERAMDELRESNVSPAADRPCRS
jgi:hypothetical protein